MSIALQKPVHSGEALTAFIDKNLYGTKAERADDTVGAQRVK